MERRNETLPNRLELGYMVHDGIVCRRNSWPFFTMLDHHVKHHVEEHLRLFYNVVVTVSIQLPSAKSCPFPGDSQEQMIPTSSTVAAGL